MSLCARQYMQRHQLHRNNEIRFLYDRGSIALRGSYIIIISQCDKSVNRNAGASLENSVIGFAKNNFQTTFLLLTSDYSQFCKVPVVVKVYLLETGLTFGNN